MKKISKYLLLPIVATLFLATLVTFPVHAQPVTKPHLEVIDDGSVDGVVDHKVVFPASANAQGTVFDVYVYLMNLDVGWAITSAYFLLTFNTTVIDTTAGDVTVNTVDWDGPWVVTVVHAIPDTIEVTVSTTHSLSGNVLIAAIRFTVANQESSPPYPSGYYDYSSLDILDVMLENHVGPVPFNPPISGEVYVYALITQVPVYVDIKPGSWPNQINVGSKGVFAVAICGTKDFNVRTIDPATVKIYIAGVAEGVSPIRWSYEDVAMEDGYLDIVFHFDTQAVVAKLGLTGHLGETLPLIIKGNLYPAAGGLPIQGQDYVWILKK